MELLRTKLLGRNEREVLPFQELIEGYNKYLRLVRELEEKLREQDGEVSVLRSQRENLEATVKATKDNLLKAPDYLKIVEKVESLQLEVSQSLRNQSQLSIQLVQSTNALQKFKEEAQQKGQLVIELQEALEASKERNTHLEELVRRKDDAVELASSEASRCREEAEETREKIRMIEMENKMLVDRWMELKITEAEKVNEANAIYQDMVERSRTRKLQELASSQTDGLLRASDSESHGIYDPLPSDFPSVPGCCVKAHEGGCLALQISHSGKKVVSGGSDRNVKLWNLSVEKIGSELVEKSSFRGALGSILDVGITVDERFILGASSDHNLYFWEVLSERRRHTLTGHTERVTCVDLNETGNKGISASSDRSLKIWDLERGFCLSTILCHSICHSLSYLDGPVVASGHSDGNLRMWDLRTLKLANEVVAHSSTISSISTSLTGNTLLTCGRDNILNVFDTRTLEVRCFLRDPGFKVATNWTRACLSPDEELAACGSIDGSVFVWNVFSGKVQKHLQSHKASTVVSFWSHRGQPLITGDKSGVINVWQHKRV